MDPGIFRDPSDCTNANSPLHLNLEWQISNWPESLNEPIGKEANSSELLKLCPLLVWIRSMEWISEVSWLNCTNMLESDMSSTGWVQKQTAPIVNMNWEDGPAGRIYEQVWMGGRECAHRSETVVVPAPQLLLLLLHSPLLLSPPPPVAPTTPRPVAFFPVTFFALISFRPHLLWPLASCNITFDGKLRFSVVGISTFLKVDNIWMWSASNMWLMWQVGMTVREWDLANC